MQLGGLDAHLEQPRCQHHNGCRIPLHLAHMMPSGRTWKSSFTTRHIIGLVAQWLQALLPAILYSICITVGSICFGHSGSFRILARALSQAVLAEASMTPCSRGLPRLQMC